MLRVKTFGVMLLSAFILLLAGALVTVEFTDDALVQFPIELADDQVEQIRWYLHASAAVCLDNPISRAFVLKTRLISLNAAPVESPPIHPGLARSGLRALSQGNTPTVTHYNYHAVFQKLTYLAIPVGQLRVNTGGSFLC